jgi:hypothetical protein
MYRGSTVASLQNNDVTRIQTCHMNATIDQAHEPPNINRQ